MGTESLQNFPNHAIGLVVVQGFIGAFIGWDDDGQDDIAELFLAVLGLAHDTPNGLHNIHLGISGGQEQHCIKGGNVHAFGQTANIGQDSAGFFGCFGLQPFQFLIFLRGIHPTVNVIGFTLQTADQVGIFGIFLQQFGPVFVHHLGEHSRDILRADLVGFPALLNLNDLSECHGAFHRFRVERQIVLRIHLRQRTPATNDF